MNRGGIGKGKESQSVDEKNLYVKRLKGSKESQRVELSKSDIARSKSAAGVVKKTPVPGPILAKSLKSKLRSPTKLKPLHGSTHYQPRVISQPLTKLEKRLLEQKQKATMKVQPESGDTIQSKKKETKLKSKGEDTPDASDTNGKASDSAPLQKDQEKEANNGVTSKDDKSESKEVVAPENNESTNSQSIELVDISDESVQLESPQKSKAPEEPVNTSPEAESPESAKNDASQPEIIVESTTSESSPAEAPGQDKPQQGDDAKPDEDPSFISYDSSIMLKDVQIKLNDCLRDNSKLMDSTDPNASENFKDLSFGRTLRGISGRSSIGRLRHVTVRDRQLTPNDSLFVNTSSASFSQDDALRYTPRFTDSPRRNGTPLDRKRKLTSEVSESAKKIRREESSIFNSSLEYLKNLRRPVQVSTPVKEFKFDIGEKSGIGEEINAGIDQTEPKKWCVVM